ncbi:hypothetical protein BpHYR1_030816 [Brachionus plicatilis]|uniref:Uncharacterized protein n=1 Tax=Brachionus plicatilis TaxID=10195 RepID=A0A3M7PAM2_BRAPC|nr:hypothetical protein BpHYR1_030816 [Brachionus plicatilis]
MFQITEKLWSFFFKLSAFKVGLDIPIQANQKKGRPKDTAGPLEHQPSINQETQTSTSAPKGIESDDDSNDESIQENVSKRPRIDSVTRGQEMFCKKCGVKMTKRRYWACPNKCAAGSSKVAVSYVSVGKLIHFILGPRNY